MRGLFLLGTAGVFLEVTFDTGLHLCQDCGQLVLQPGAGAVRPSEDAAFSAAVSGDLQAQSSGAGVRKGGAAG